ncbi:hypothetical protein BSL78_11827 [Apostichopus japonicus]|uniref:Ig-like domain-containing protein n=1 Tax=Stichopus japonicus TaxID=307972 RepID=A0A2G8KTD7_STIJA|nr:hypothetical protein BSL78_11827 [Apostichopus japonicus]
MKGNLDGVISCVHHNTRPAATISWFMRDGTHDIPLNSTTNQTLSADLITFSVTSEMAIGQILLLVNMQSLVLLVCKSHNPYSVVQESDSKVLLDISQNDPFEKQPDLPEDPVYAIQNQDLVLECPLTIAVEDSIVLWMAKSLETKNSGYLIYSAYGVVPSMDTDEQVSLDKSGDLVISQVGLQHEGQYACVHSTVNNTKSFLQRVEVIVQPTPSKVLVEGCKLFQPCSFYITETKTITCKVNGVHPEMELKIKALSTNLAVINTEVSTYEDEGLFYTSIYGDVIVVDDSCQENGTIICQALGPAAYIFKSDVHITISSHREKCPQISDAPLPADKAVWISPYYIIILTITVASLICIVLLPIIVHIKHRRNRRHLDQLDSRVFDVEKKLDDSKKDNYELKERLAKQEEGHQKLLKINNDMEQYSRRNNLRIFGMKEDPNENTMDVFVKLAKEKLKLELNTDFIDRCHRLGRSTPGHILDPY